MFYNTCIKILKTLFEYISTCILYTLFCADFNFLYFLWSIVIISICATTKISASYHCRLFSWETKKLVLYVKLVTEITNLNESPQILHNAVDSIQFTQTSECRLDFVIHAGFDNCLHKVFCYKCMAMGLQKRMDWYVKSKNHFLCNCILQKKCIPENRLFSTIVLFLTNYQKCLPMAKILKPTLSTMCNKLVFTVHLLIVSDILVLTISKEPNQLFWYSSNSTRTCTIKYNVYQNG